MQSRVLTFLFLAGLMAACGPSVTPEWRGLRAIPDDPSQPGQKPRPPMPRHGPVVEEPITNSQSSDQLALLRADLASIDQLDNQALQKFDSQRQNLLTHLFGGTSHFAIRRFLDERLKIFLTVPSLRQATFLPGEFAPQMEQAIAPGTIFDDPRLSILNVGTFVFQNSLIAHVHASIKIRNLDLPIPTPEVGLVVLGPGYKSTVTNQSGEAIAAPSLWRISHLIHEARHSECTLEAKEKITAIRNGLAPVGDLPETCGYTHSTCTTPGSVYKGEINCDSRPWGPWTITGVFAEATLMMALSVEDRAFMESVAVDSYSRLNFDVEKMFIDGPVKSATTDRQK